MSAKLSAQALSMSFQVYLPDLAAAIIKQSEMSRDLWGTYVRHDAVSIHDRRGLYRRAHGTQRDLRRDQFWIAASSEARAADIDLGERFARLD
jgi:hypothetical protein